MSRRTRTRGPNTARAGVRLAPRQGSALLAVLWLSVALTVIAFALSRGVRSELDRASLNVDSTKAYYLAHGAIEATMRRVVDGFDSDRPEMTFAPGQSFMLYQFETGRVEVEIIGESGKLDVNSATPEQMARLIAAFGVDASLAVSLASGIARYREQLRGGEMYFGMTKDRAMESFDFLDPDSSFQASQASIQELEELLLVPGMTPEIFYGAYRADAKGRLRRTGGLMENLTTRGSGALNLNYASPQMMAAGGLSPTQVESVTELRRQRPLGSDDQGFSAPGALSDDFQFSMGGAGEAYTLRAHAELSNGRARRTVTALIERNDGGGPDPVRVVRWYDTAF